jgi:mono/diheme cytochrome c family protein
MRFLAVIGLLAILVAIAAAVFAFGGFYSVAATEAESDPIAWVLIRVRQASISRHATVSPPVALDDPALVQAGARAFAARGCHACHGAPGVTWEKFSEAMQPDPPDLKEVAAQVSASEIFWVVKNGIKMTGMPGFAAIGVDDKEIWSITALVKKFPSVSDADYKAWTAAAK